MIWDQFTGFNGDISMQIMKLPFRLYGKGVDQLQQVIEGQNLKLDIVGDSNKCLESFVNEMATRNVLFQFHVTQKKLSCTVSKNGDIGLVIPFNIVYSAFTHLIAHHCDLKPYEFIYFKYVIYEDHVETLKTK